MAGGFAVRAASQPLPSGQRARGAPSLESEARRRRRAKDLGLEADETPLGQREAISLSEARQLSAEQRGEKRQLEAEARSEERQIAGEGRAQKRSLEIEAERSKASQAKLDAKAQEERDKLNATRSIVGLGPILGEQPSLAVDPKEIEAIRQQQGAPAESAQFGGNPVLAPEAPKPLVTLDDDIREAVGTGRLTLEQARSYQGGRNTELAKHQKAEATAKELDDQLMATVSDLRPAASQEELAQMIATAKARGMKPAQLATELRMERSEMDKIAAKEKKTQEEHDKIQAQYGSAIKSVFPEISDEDLKERMDDATEGRVPPSTFESRLLRERSDRKEAMKTAKAQQIAHIASTAVKAWNDGDDAAKDAILRQIREDLASGTDEEKIAAVKAQQNINRIARLPE